MISRFFLILATVLVAVVATPPAHADRVKDLASVAAVRTNQLVGYGLVVGLQGTGDGADVSLTVQTVRAMMNKMGVGMDGPLTDFERAVSAAGRLDVKNTAAVMVTAELPGMSKPGQRIDVNVATLGKASSLRGGTLILTSLRGIDGEVYALAQGVVNTTGIDANAAGSKVAIGVPTSARIPNGATVERIVDNPFDKSEFVVMNVREQDFTTTRAIVDCSARRATITSMAPAPLIVPAKTRNSGPDLSNAASAALASSVGRLSTGTLSPVTGAWLTLVVPTTTTPSAGSLSFGRTMTTSPS